MAWPGPAGVILANGSGLCVACLEGRHVVDRVRPERAEPSSGSPANRAEPTIAGELP